MTDEEKEFAQLSGTIIHNCGFLEFLTNAAIDVLGTDDVLTTEIFKLTFRRRIDILCRLLKERTKLPNEKFDSLYKQLCSVADQRNIVAHNPVVLESSLDTNPHIIVLRGLTDKRFTAKKLDQKDLENLLEETRETIRTFQSLAAEAKILQPEFSNQQNKV